MVKNKDVFQPVATSTEGQRFSGKTEAIHSEILVHTNESGIAFTKLSPLNLDCPIQIVTRIKY